MPTIGALSVLATHGAVERGVAEVEDAAVGGDQPVPLAVGSGGHPDDRRIEMLPAHRPVEPRVTEVKTPPSAATNQYPPPSGVAAMPTTGA